MRKTLAIFVSVIYALIGLVVGFFIGAFFDSDVIFLTLPIVCAIIGGFGCYFSRRVDEKCDKCGALWSVELENTQTLTQNAIKEKTTNYLVGEEKLIYRCKQCGCALSKIQQYKRKV